MKQKPNTKNSLRVELPPDIIQAIKREAAEEGPTLVSIVESALREHVVRKELAKSKKKARVQILDARVPEKT